jgi:3-phenylpropionate/trans-cinnamate dioxygenase ferredoxin subunit
MTRFVRVIAAAEIPADRGRLVFTEGMTIVLFKLDGAIHALDDSCPHAGSSLAAGELEGVFIQCRGHGLHFDVRTGRMRGADSFCAKTYPVRVVDGEVAIGIE